MPIIRVMIVRLVVIIVFACMSLAVVSMSRVSVLNSRLTKASRIDAVRTPRQSTLSLSTVPLVVTFVNAVRLIVLLNRITGMAPLVSICDWEIGPVNSSFTAWLVLLLVMVPVFSRTAIITIVTGVMSLRALTRQHFLGAARLLLLKNVSTELGSDLLRLSSMALTDAQTGFTNIFTIRNTVVVMMNSNFRRLEVAPI